MLLAGCVLHLEDGIYLDHDPHLDGSGRVRSKSCLCLERGADLNQGLLLDESGGSPR